MPVTAVGAGSSDPDPAGIAELVARYVQLSVDPAGRLRGRCPFCGSSTFQVRPRPATFHCFGCGAGGGREDFSDRVGHS